MSGLRGLLEVLRALFRRDVVEREMAEEFEFHFEREVESLLEAGLTPAAARAEAHRRFGGVDRFAEATRDARGLRWLDDLRADVRYALRGMRRAPGAMIVTVLTLALGLGATVTIFSVVNGVLIEPLPYPNSDRLVSVWGRFLPESGFDFPVFPVSPPEYTDYREQNTVMADVAGYAPTGATLVQADGEAVRVRAASVTSNLFAVLDVPPLLGRAFSAEEDRPDAAPVTILSHGLWQSAFGGDPDIVGRQVRLNGRTTAVVGVMPPRFSFPGDDRQLWVPLGLELPGNRSSHFFRAIARLREGATLERANAEMTTLMERWKADYPDIHTGHFLFLSRLVDDVVGGVRRGLVLALGSVAVVLLLVCVNVAHVLLARNVTRRRELAVRVALGASSRRIAQQVLAESGVLALVGTVLGVIGAKIALGPVLALAAPALPRTTTVAMDGRVAAIAAGLCVLVTILSGLLPALRARKFEPQAVLREGDRAASGGLAGTRLRGALVVTEVALAALVVVAAGLLGRSFSRLAAVDPGVNPDHVLIANVSLPGGTYASPDSRIAFHRRLRERLLAIPGVEAVSGASSLPLFSGPGAYDFAIADRAPPAPGELALNADFVFTMPGLLEAQGRRLLAGRFIEESDTETSLPVTVISATMARQFFPAGNAIGQRIRISGNEDSGWMTIVGIVEDARYGTLDVAPRPSYYAPVAQAVASEQNPPLGLFWSIRSTGDPVRLGPAVRSALREIDPGLPLTRLDPYTRIVSESLARPRFTLSLIATFAGLAMLLGALGLYGVLSWQVAERTREMGIRLALGARRSEVAGLVIGHGVRLTLLGLATGLLASVVLGRVLTALLFEVSPLDGATYAAVAASLLTVALVASAVPALRAVRLDPVRVLRS